MLDGLKNEDARAQFADYASLEIDNAKEINRAILGKVPPFKIFVDGQEGATLSSVKADGVIVVEFELVTDALKVISDMLHQHSPTKTGTYKRSHVLLADGAEVDPSGANVPPADEYVFINTVPYARRIERGSSSQAPDGVYQAVAMLARGRFGNIARITYSFRTVSSGKKSERNPAVVVRLNR